MGKVSRFHVLKYLNKQMPTLEGTGDPQKRASERASGAAQVVLEEIFQSHCLLALVCLGFFMTAYTVVVW